MRVIVTLLAIVVVIAIVAVATGFVNLHGNSGSMPTVAVKGGALPSVKADVGSIDLGTKNQTVEVPKLSLDKKQSTVAMPTIAVKKAQ